MQDTKFLAEKFESAGTSPESKDSSKWIRLGRQTTQLSESLRFCAGHQHWRISCRNGTVLVLHSNWWDEFLRTVDEVRGKMLNPSSTFPTTQNPTP